MAFYAPPVKVHVGSGLTSSFGCNPKRPRLLKEPHKNKTSNFCTCLLDIDLDVFRGVFAEQWLRGETLSPGEPIFHCCACGTHAVQRQPGGDAANRNSRHGKESGKKEKKNNKMSASTNKKGSSSDGNGSTVSSAKSSNSHGGRCSNSLLTDFFSNWFGRKHKHTHHLDGSLSSGTTSGATAASASASASACMKSAAVCTHAVTTIAATVDEPVPITPRTEQELFICVTCGACYCRSHAWDHNYSRGNANEVLSGPLQSKQTTATSTATVSAYYPNHSFFVGIPSYVSTHPCHIRSETDWGLLFPCVLVKEIEDGQIGSDSPPQEFYPYFARLVSGMAERHDALQPHRRHNSAPMLHTSGRDAVSDVDGENVSGSSSPYSSAEAVRHRDGGCGCDAHTGRTSKSNFTDDHATPVSASHNLTPHTQSSVLHLMHASKNGNTNANNSNKSDSSETSNNGGMDAAAHDRERSVITVPLVSGVLDRYAAHAAATVAETVISPSSAVQATTLSLPVYYGAQTSAEVPSWGYLVWCARCSVRPLCLSNRGYHAEQAAHHHLRLLGHTLALLAYFRLRGVRLCVPLRYSEYTAYQLQVQLSRQTAVQQQQQLHHQQHANDRLHPNDLAQMRSVTKTTEMMDWTGFGSRPAPARNHAGDVGGDYAAGVRRVPVASRLYVDRTLARFGICGFANPNYFCYINAVLQCVLRCMYFCRPLLRLGMQGSHTRSSSGACYSSVMDSAASGLCASANSTTSPAAVLNTHKRYLSSDRVSQSVLGNGLTMAMFRLVRHLHGQTYQDVLNRAANPFVHAVYNQVCRRGCGGICGDECFGANATAGANSAVNGDRYDEDNKYSGCLFEVDEQQDAHELLITLLNGVADEMDWGKSDAEKAIAKRISFEGIVRTEVLCCVCRNSVARGEKFMSISVPVQPTLQESLDKVFKDSYLVDKNRYACENCFAQMSAQTQQMHNETVKVMSEEAAARRCRAAVAASGGGKCSSGGGTVGGFFGFKSAKSSSRPSGARCDNGSDIGSNNNNIDKAEKTASESCLAANCVYQDAIVHTEVERLGETLVIHLLRFQYNVEKQNFNKDTTPVHISFEIDLTPYASSSILQEYNQVQDYHALQRRFQHIDEPTCRRYFSAAGKSYRAAVAMMLRDGLVPSHSQECSFDLNRSPSRKLCGTGEGNRSGSAAVLSEHARSQSPVMTTKESHESTTHMSLGNENRTSRGSTASTLPCVKSATPLVTTGNSSSIVNVSASCNSTHLDTAPAMHDAGVPSTPPPQVPTTSSVTVESDSAACANTPPVGAAGKPDTLSVDDFVPYNDNMSSSPPTLVRRLVGIVTHRGSLHSGHYIAFVRYLAKPDMWFRCDDEQVDLVDRKTVEEASVDTYLAFYE